MLETFGVAKGERSERQAGVAACNHSLNRQRAVAASAANQQQSARIGCSFHPPRAKMCAVDVAEPPRLHAEPTECYFWRTHKGAELDLLVIRGKRRIGVEVKRTTAPAVTPSMRIAQVDLKLTELHVVHAGDTSFPLSGEITAVALRDLMSAVRPLD